MEKWFSLNINKKPYRVKSSPDMPLLWVLRHKLNLTGTKYGCGKGHCGACTVHINNKSIRSCSLSIQHIDPQHNITTIEGLSQDNTHPLQIAWQQYDVPQCGYCQSGQLMSAVQLLKDNPKPTAKEIILHMSGNLCRCGTYQRILKAIYSVSKQPQTMDT